MAESFQQLDRDGTHLVGYIECDYQTLVDCFGEPKPEHCDGYKTDVEWRVAENSLSYPIAIYNWKNGKNYCGRFGLPVKDIKRWNIGGKNSSDVSLIEQVLRCRLQSRMRELERKIDRMDQVRLQTEEVLRDYQDADAQAYADREGT